LPFCWNDQVERIVQTMVYEDAKGQIQDILRPENHIQVMRAMWEEPASDFYPQISCPTIIIPAGPTAERAGSERAKLKQQGVEAAAKSIEGEWISTTNLIHFLGSTAGQRGEYRVLKGSELPLGELVSLAGH
jgi:hypothetical protein